MPVIINDFEVTVEPPRRSDSAAQSTPPAGAQAGATGQRLRPTDIEQIVRYFWERRKRIAAD